MKKLLNIVASVGVALSLLVGCATINSLTPAQIAQIGTVITQVSDEGALYAVQQDNRNAAYFKAAIPVLDNFANGTDLTPSALQLALSNTTLGTNQWVSLAITGVVVAYDASYSKYISGQLTNLLAAKVWIVAVETGFKEATGTALVKGAKPVCPTFVVNGKVDASVIKARVKAATVKK
jgi:hypothetical protein